MKRTASVRTQTKKYRKTMVPRLIGETHWFNKEMRPGSTSNSYYYEVSDIVTGGELNKRLANKVYFTNLYLKGWINYDLVTPANNLAPVRVMIVQSKAGPFATGGSGVAPTVATESNHNLYTVLYDKFHVCNKPAASESYPTTFNIKVKINKTTHYTNPLTGSDTSCQNPIFCWFISDSGAGFTLKAASQLYWRDY